MNLSASRKILLCLRYGIGDLVMELPVLGVLRSAAPAARITALGARPALELLAGDRRVDRLSCVQDWGFRHWGDYGTPTIRTAIREWFAAEAFDLVLDPSHAVMGAGAAIWDSRATILDAGSDLQDRALATGLDGLAAINAAVQAGWGISIPAAAVPRLELAAAEISFAAGFLRTHGLAGRPVGFSPVASSPLKRWPVARFAALADRLIENGESLLLFAGPQRQFGEDIRRRLRRPERAVAVGPLHLRRVAALLARCRLFLGHDTGLMHLAAAVGTPLVALFGPTSPQIYLPGQVPAIACGGRDGCTWRKTRAFGPPKCVMEGRCLAGKRSCIDEVDLAQVWDAVAGVLAYALPRMRCIQGVQPVVGRKIMRENRAPSRVLDLAELESPPFRRTAAAMDAMAARETVSYLHPSKRWEYPWALEQAALSPGDQVLDAGCGASIFPVYLAACGCPVSACDLDLPGRLDRLHGVRVNYARGDLAALPFASGRFAAVFCISVLEHLPWERMPLALAELHRVLRPGGRLLLTTDFCRQAGEEMWYQGPGEPFRVDWNVFDEDQLRRIVLAAPGFRLTGPLDLTADWPHLTRRCAVSTAIPTRRWGSRWRRNRRSGTRCAVRGARRSKYFRVPRPSPLAPRFPLCSPLPPVLLLGRF